MDGFSIENRVQELCQARSWSLYRLAREAGMPYSTLSTVLYKTASPSLASIERICGGFGISLAQFFSPEDERALLTAEERACLALYATVESSDRALVLAYMQALSDRARVQKEIETEEEALPV